VAFDVAGPDAPSIVLVHGWSCHRGHWDAQRDALADEFKVVTVDLAGHGDSSTCRKEWTIEAFGADVQAVVDSLALDDVLLVGHSMGGDVVLEAARRLQGRVHGLVWVDAYSALPHARSAGEVLRVMTPFRKDFRRTTQEFVRRLFHPRADAALVERVALEMSSADPGVALGAMESALTYARGIPDLLSELRLPIAAINPDSSTTDVKSLNSFGIAVALIPGVGHFPMMEDPSAFNRALLGVARQFMQSQYQSDA